MATLMRQQQQQQWRQLPNRILVPHPDLLSLVVEIFTQGFI